MPTPNCCIDATVITCTIYCTRVGIGTSFAPPHARPWAGRSALEVGVVTPYILRATSILARSPLPPYPTGVYNL